MQRRHRTLALLAFCGLLGLLAPTALATVYKYVDENGVAHYTDSVSQIPAPYRRQVKDITDDLQRMEGFRVVPRSGDPGSAASAREESADLDLGELDLSGGDVAGDILETLGFGVILLALLAVPVLWVLSGLIFKMACRIAGEDPPGLGRACGILFAQGLCGSVVGSAVGGIGMAMGIDETASIASSIAVGGASMMLSWMANAGILVSMMGYDFLKSMWIGFLHTLLVLLMIGGPIGVLALIGVLLA